MSTPPDSLKLFEFYHSMNWKLLRFTGIDPLVKIFPDRIRVTRVYCAIAFIAVNFIILPQFYAITTQPVDIEMMLEVAGTILIFLNASSRIIILVYHRDVVLKQEETSRNLWKETVSSEEISQLSIYAKKSKALTIFYLTSCRLLVASYLIAPLIVSWKNNFEDRITLPYLIGTELESNFTLIGIYIAQISALSIVCHTFAGADLIMPVLLFQACGHLKVLQLKLNNIDKTFIASTRFPKQDVSAAHNSVAENLKKCIQRHQVILSACLELEDSFNSLGLLEAVCIVYHICLAGIGVLLAPDESFKFCAHLGTLTLKLFLLCWASDNLTTESLEVANAAFSIPWYQFPGSVQTNTSIMMSRAQKSCHLTAGKYFVLSLEAYTALMSNGFSAFAVMRTLT